MNKRIFRITVNGRVYEVEVEEISSTSVGTQVSQNTTPAPSAPPVSAPSISQVSPPKPQSAPVSAPAAEKKPKAPAPEGGTVVSAPMPGKILKVAVKEGESVSKGDLLVVLEAMKMENEIFSPADGVVKQVAVSAGDSVNTGDLLVVIG